MAQARMNSGPKAREVYADITTGKRTVKTTEDVTAFLKETAQMRELATDSKEGALIAKLLGHAALVQMGLVQTPFLQKTGSEFMRMLGAQFKPRANDETSDSLWAKFGSTISPFWRELAFSPGNIFINGPIQALAGKETKAVAQRAPREKQEDVVAVRAEDATESALKDKAEAINARRSQSIRQFLQQGRLTKHKLYKLVKLKDGSTLRMYDMVEALFDPFSYTQTVENLFYFSFLVKQCFAGVYMVPASTSCEGAAGASSASNDDDGMWPHIQIFVDKETSERMGSSHMLISDDGLPGDKAAEQASSSKEGRRQSAGAGKEGNTSNAQQFVFEIDQDSWARLIKSRGITEPFLPHWHMPDCKGCQKWKHEDALAAAMYAAPTKQEAKESKMQPAAGQKRARAAKEAEEDTDDEGETTV